MWLHILHKVSNICSAWVVQFMLSFHQNDPYKSTTSKFVQETKVLVKNNFKYIFKMFKNIKVRKIFSLQISQHIVIILIFKVCELFVS